LFFAGFINLEYTSIWDKCSMATYRTGWRAPPIATNLA